VRVGDLGLVGGAGWVAGLLLDALEPDLLPAAVERLLILARARRVQAVLRDALLRLERDPARACDALGVLAGAA
jgi:hypothetical protein